MKKSILNNYSAFVVLFVLTQSMYAQGIFGKWKTIDDKTGVAKAIVEVYENKGLLNAKIIQVLEKGREDAVCINCKGDLKNQPVKGMHIIKDFKKNGSQEYKGSNLLDPESGTTYRGKLWLDSDNPDKLKVRGYIAFLYRTQTWHRLKEGK
ncbi:DUF2147 domain-containing protein [Flagellimonas meridianipacifica]|uniref:Uncharacterized protein (DUF2147 family) n=1 Tax=Flagellimonas meridianipacifica TaxID=1080225 RepID=A0A2T0MA94_9FLAO|nr:DUF2147 domain-containing protein [Allomuricauda pacifica]PRX54456.1 uncharacterized protein (DUF2147 family) [Allomuricauda pacifica]